MKKNTFCGIVVLGILFFSKCFSFGDFLFLKNTSVLTNLTPPTVQRNASNRYRFLMHSKMLENRVLPYSFKPAIVIDGQTYPLTQESFNKHFFFYDHVLSPQRTAAAYYFMLSYDKKIRGKVRTKTIKTSLAELKIQACGVFALDVDRAPVGAEVHVLGHGFTNRDRIVVGDCNAPTQYVSENVLSFQVPLLVVNNTKPYPVWLLSDESRIFIGNLLLDNSQLHVNVTNIELEKGQKMEIEFSVDRVVANDGLDLNITTNIPDSVIMPEISIPAGTDRVSVPIEGGEPGQGNLFVNAIGYDELSIPIKITSSDRTEEANTEEVSENSVP